MAPHPPTSGAPMAAPAVPSRFFRESIGPAAIAADSMAGQNGSTTQAGSRPKPSAELAVVLSDVARTSGEHVSHGPSVDVDSAQQHEGGKSLQGEAGSGVSLCGLL
jgi:hypothetical protein